MAVNTDINDRWENGIPHDKRSVDLYKSIARIDYKYCSDSFDFTSGGDGDNGETLMYILDVHFALEDEKRANEMLFINFDRNYADEFDCSGFVVMKRGDWEKYLSKMTDEFFEGGQEIRFGSNESFEFDNREDYLSAYSAREITQEEFLVIKKFFGGSIDSCFMIQSGDFPFFEDEMYDGIERDDEDESDGEDEDDE